MLKPASIAKLHQAIQKAALPGVWSKGVALARAESVIPDSLAEDEIKVRIAVKDRTVSPRVTLWPEDEDWFCDCGDRNDPCFHIAAAVVALKNGTFQTSKSASSDGEPGEMSAGISEPVIQYRLIRHGNELQFERAIRGQILRDSLVSYIGGIQSGRIAAAPVPATQDDFAVDRALGLSPQTLKPSLDPATWTRLLKALEAITPLAIENADGTPAIPIRTSSQTTGIEALVRDEGGGFRVLGEMDASITDVFSNGLALCGDKLRRVRQPELTTFEKKLLSREGHFFSRGDAGALASEVIPELQKKLPVKVLTQKLPGLSDLPPRIVLELSADVAAAGSPERLRIVPRLVYGNPAVAEIHNDRIEMLPGTGPSADVPRRDPATEKMLVRDLQSELHLRPGQPVAFEGDAAVDFRMRIARSSWSVQGTDLGAFELQGALEPRISSDGSSFSVEFVTGGVKLGGTQAGGRGGDQLGLRSVDAAQVFQAWRDNQNYIPLLGGGFAPLPKDWLARYGKRVIALLTAKNERGELPPYRAPEIAELCEDLGQACPEPLLRVREVLENFEGISDATLPADLRADLREYQKKGVNWLCFLRDARMGAMLADDMGLGKTLQALCALKGRTLIVAPTSVLSSWTEQIERFRPGLSTLLYHGPGRRLDASKQITVTSYAVLRLDRELLTAQDWNTVILDEAQNIKNPESQVARAAHQLRGEFRLSLSGTPVENRLDDLWSQFQFANPGLLGSRETFQDQFAGPIARGDQDAARRLRRRIRPFLLRRLKREVAPELPPRTETVLHCEFSESENELYQSILAASRQEVLEKLETGGNVFAALEALLRLRQACCHPSLIPGQSAPISSKTELLLQTLDNSIEQGHRALIFSQWTSYLNLIEPHLRERGISFSRLDGSTQNRAEVVADFQKETGPSAMLISLKAGGVGLTLTAADHIFILDPWWNPAAEDQAADRAHRIGQENPVLIHRLVAKDTVEDRILALQKRKLELAGAALEDSARSLSLGREDLLALLQ